VRRCGIEMRMAEKSLRAGAMEWHRSDDGERRSLHVGERHRGLQRRLRRRCRRRPHLGSSIDGVDVRSREGLNRHAQLTQLKSEGSRGCPRSERSAWSQARMVGIEPWSRDASRAARACRKLRNSVATFTTFRARSVHSLSTVTILEGGRRTPPTSWEMLGGRSAHS